MSMRRTIITLGFLAACGGGGGDEDPFDADDTAMARDPACDDDIETTCAEITLEFYQRCGKAPLSNYNWRDCLAKIDESYPDRKRMCPGVFDDAWQCHEKSECDYDRSEANDEDRVEAYEAAGCG